jgi:hypothetical protein
MKEGGPRHEGRQVKRRGDQGWARLSKDYERMVCGRGVAWVTTHEGRRRVGGVHDLPNADKIRQTDSMRGGPCVPKVSEA